MRLHRDQRSAEQELAEVFGHAILRLWRTGSVSRMLRADYEGFDEVLGDLIVDGIIHTVLLQVARGVAFGLSTLGAQPNLLTAVAWFLSSHHIFILIDRWLVSLLYWSERCGLRQSSVPP